MKLVTFIRSGSENEELGLLRGEGVLPLGEHGFSYADMNELICRSTAEERAAMAAAEGETLPLASVRLLSPIPRPTQPWLPPQPAAAEWAACTNMSSEPR